MPSVYKRKSSSLSYKDYTDEKLEECLEAIRSGRLSQRKAEAEFKVSRATIENKLKNSFLKKPRHPTILTNNEEKACASHIMLTPKTNSRKKINVAADQSICPDDIEEANIFYVSETEQQPVLKTGRSKRFASPESSLEEDDNYSTAISLESNESFEADRSDSLEKFLKIVKVNDDLILSSMVDTESSVSTIKNSIIQREEINLEPKYIDLIGFDKQFESLLVATLFSSLDLTDGYLQIPLSENAKPTTAFITPDEKDQFNRIVFGLVNTLFEFRRLMALVLRHLKNKVVLISLDGILVPATSWEEMFHKLTLVFKALQDANLTLRLTKCRFGKLFRVRKNVTETESIVHVDSQATSWRTEKERLSTSGDIPDLAFTLTPRRFCFGLTGGKSNRSFTPTVKPQAGGRKKLGLRTEKDR
ncbi:hypothetical protein ILUMI_13469 [Ignelater luminosus]|uniref:Uncharacterized protein n=1 Tax=Ignelater luminosus TaxID=2038154 RepID=A0A8K0CSD1_IGNLU|nr:hypothetical protein ILUMI_13469 [Ignelater luminosus]